MLKSILVIMFLAAPVYCLAHEEASPQFRGSVRPTHIADEGMGYQNAEAQKGDGAYLWLLGHVLTGVGIVVWAARSESKNQDVF